MNNPSLMLNFIDVRLKNIIKSVMAPNILLITVATPTAIIGSILITYKNKAFKHTFKTEDNENYYYVGTELVKE